MGFRDELLGEEDKMGLTPHALAVIRGQPSVIAKVRFHIL